MQKLGRKVSTTEKDTEKRALGREMETKRKGQKKYFKIRATEKKDRERIKKNPYTERTMAETPKMGSKKEGEAKTKKVERKRGCYWKRARVRQRARDRPRLTQGHLRGTGTKRKRE